MRVNIFSCLSAFVLACNVTAAVIHEIVEVKTSVTLPCPHSVEGKVTWSRESNGRKVDILTADGDGDIRHNDPFKRYSSLVDKSLHIRRVNISDTGRYFCDNEAAVELTVIPSGTTRHNVVVRTSVRLKCSFQFAGSDVPTWIRLNRDKRLMNVTVFSQNNKEEHTRFSYSAEEKMLTITDVQPDDSGLYCCDGKPAAYLNVIKDEQSERAPVLVLGLLFPLLIIIFIILFLIWRCRIKRRGSGEQMVEVVYNEITDELVFELTQGGSNQHDVTYANIQDLPALGTKTVTSRPNETPYSFINKPGCHGTNEPWRLNP